MRYQGQASFAHQDGDRTGILLVHLGTPDAPTASAQRRYLAEFLGDPRVVEVPRPIWLAILYGIILPLRSPRSAHAYSAVWTERGSPLRAHSEDLAAALQAQLSAAGHTAEVRLAMRYGRPGIGEVLERWREDGLRRLLVLPLYPQYSATTTAAVFDEVMAQLRRWRWLPELRWVNDYFAEPGWITAIADSIRRHWAAHGRAQRLLFSFHGIPQRYLRNGDPYFCQCHASARRIAEALQLEASQWQLSFQSRVGREPWLQPYTDLTLQALPGEGVRTVDVVCPGFAVDCLETLEEIAMQNAESFVAAGGESLRYIPALNADTAHAAVLADVVRRHGGGWAGLDLSAPASEPGRAARRAAYAGPQA